VSIFVFYLESVLYNAQLSTRHVYFFVFCLVVVEGSLSFVSLFGHLIEKKESSEQNYIGRRTRRE
jgi:hypothetical protein